MRDMAARIPPQAGHLISSEQQRPATRQHHRYDSDEQSGFTKPACANADAKTPPPAITMSLPPLLPGTSKDLQADGASSILVTRLTS
jgi:hypothetical protein